MQMILSAGAMLMGFALEMIYGWKTGLWHPICGIGTLIARLETLLRGIFPQDKRGERIAGGILAVVVPLVVWAIAFIALKLAWSLHWILGFVLETIACYSIFATRSLYDAGMSVHQALEQEGLEAGRQAVAMVVGRDTAALSKQGVIKATVETIAENLSDGIIAPMLFVLLGGAPLGFFYKAVNTLDSMVGYKNEEYQFFGTASAKLDDICNFIPARVSAVFLLIGGKIRGMDMENGKRIFLRDRLNHASPNSAQTESVMAGLLHIQLAGDAFYFGKLYRKKTIGDADCEVCEQDIVSACDLLYTTCRLGALVIFALRIILGLLFV